MDKPLGAAALDREGVGSTQSCAIEKSILGMASGSMPEPRSRREKEKGKKQLEGMQGDRKLIILTGSLCSEGGFTNFTTSIELWGLSLCSGGGRRRCIGLHSTSTKRTLPTEISNASFIYSPCMCGQGPHGTS